jgi:hypothetical protein
MSTLVLVIIIIILLGGLGYGGGLYGGGENRYWGTAERVNDFDTAGFGI